MQYFRIHFCLILEWLERFISRHYEFFTKFWIRKFYNTDFIYNSNTYINRKKAAIKNVHICRSFRLITVLFFN